MCFEAIYYSGDAALQYFEAKAKYLMSHLLATSDFTCDGTDGGRMHLAVAP